MKEMGAYGVQFWGPAGFTEGRIPVRVFEVSIEISRNLRKRCGLMEFCDQVQPFFDDFGWLNVAHFLYFWKKLSFLHLGELGIIFAAILEKRITPLMRETIVSFYHIHDRNLLCVRFCLFGLLLEYVVICFFPLAHSILLLRRGHFKVINVAQPRLRGDFMSIQKRSHIQKPNDCQRVRLNKVCTGNKILGKFGG